MNDLKAEYTRIWKENAMSVRKYCLTQMREDTEKAEDIVLEVFALLWKKMITDGTPADAKVWLYATLKRVMKEQHTAK